MIILRLHAMPGPMRVRRADAIILCRGCFADVLRRPEAIIAFIDQRPSRSIAVHDQLERIVVQTRLRKIPVIVVRFVEKIKPVEPFHPAHFHTDIEIFGIGAGMFFRVVVQLVQADDVTFRHHRPIVGITVDARNLVRRKLEDLIGLLRFLEGANV